MATPKTTSTRLVLPRALAGAEPSSADAGTLSFDDATDEVRIKTSVGWKGLITQAGSLWHYRANTGVTSGDPGSGKISWNNAAQDSATTLYISHLDDDNNDVDVLLALVSSGSSLVIQDRDDSTRYQTWTVSGSPSRPGAYWSIPVTLSSSAGGNLPNNHQVSAITRGGGGGAGSAAAWHDGAGAPSGALGADGDYYLNDSNGDVYAKGGGAWSVVANIKGATGSTGSTGAAGPSNTITTTDPATLTSGSIPDGTLFSRSGTNFIGRKVGDFTQKATPTTADKILISDAAASDAVKYATVSSIVTLSATSNPYIDAPGSPHADNDEFTSFSGWTVWDSVANAVLIDDGDGSIDPWTFPAGGHFRRKTVGSTLLIQLPRSNNSVFIYKAITPASNMLVWARFAGWTETSVSAATCYTAFGYFPASGGRPTTTGSQLIEFANISNVGRKVVVNHASNRSSATTIAHGVPIPSIAGWFHKNTTAHYAFTLSDNGDLQYDVGSPDVTSAPITVAYVGWRVSGPGSQSNGNAMCPIWTFDYFRRKDAATAWVV